MTNARLVRFCAVCWFSCALQFTGLAEERAATFFRAVNLNGTPVVIDQRQWEGKDAPNLRVKGGAFENHAVFLKPPTDPERTEMIRSSIWGSNAELLFTGLPAGAYQVRLYVWEDNHSVSGKTITVNNSTLL